MLNKECCYFVNTQPELRSAQPTKLPTSSRPIYTIRRGGAMPREVMGVSHSSSPPRTAQGQLGRKIAVATLFFLRAPHRRGSAPVSRPVVATLRVAQQF